MMGRLLLRGLLVGLLAGILAFPFAYVLGEPPVEKAISIEEQNALAAGAIDDEPPLVSREVQRTIGLGAGLIAYGAGIGGILALVLAFANGRLGAISPRAAAATVAGLGYVSVVLVPALMYPANPPAVGDPDTIGYRTQLFGFAMVASIAAMVSAIVVARRLAHSFGSWNASVTGVLAYLAAVGVLRLAMPYLNEVPEEFPAVILWEFRTASLIIQAVLWSAIGFGLGAFTQHQFAQRGYGASRANVLAR